MEKFCLLCFIDGKTSALRYNSLKTLRQDQRRHPFLNSDYVICEWVNSLYRPVFINTNCISLASDSSVKVQGLLYRYKELLSAYDSGYISKSKFEVL